ncbi:hypothetical protein IM660_03910 [Ruania alkalisoli]|uniref:Uncharacterized protein n=1 Tax=Ruania alkalisoli TaxID=2779775 RepID=A0A7M1SXJ0_9MICO|nr:hypothetical protein [Ruania alkalisoli]QOR71452.1 hypothetical protein IM660_03910 [Ruania alkalisoli]
MSGSFLHHARVVPRALRRAARLSSPAALVSVLSGWSVLSIVLGRVLLPADCVSADGVAGFVAANLAQMRSVAACPTGTLGYGPHTLAAVGACAALLAALVVAHVTLTGVALWVARAAAGVRGVLAALRILPGKVRVPQLLPRAEQPSWYSRPARTVLQVRPVWRRGPPVLV